MLPSFKEKIEGYEQARKTTSSSTAFGNTASKGSSQRRPPEGLAQPSSRSRAPRGRDERDRCLAWRGRCFHCAKENYLLLHCNYPENVNCNLCSATGHITPACSQLQNVCAIQQLPASAPASQTLASAYNGGTSFPAGGASTTWTASSSSSTSSSSSPSRAGAFYTLVNRPTPETVTGLARSLCAWASRVLHA